jgi:4,5-DOPA dioxygenase extradiol
MTSQSNSRMPVLFVGHGSPMNVILDNAWSRGFASLGSLVPTPRAILAVSAHWFVDGTFLTGERRPKTIHDFYGFPQALYDIQYPAPGQPELAEHVRRLLAREPAAISGEWGFDHGTWSVLRFMYPDAKVPLIQLSLDRRLSAAEHIELAGSLSQLRDEGVLILGSGNLTHNLRDAMTRLRQPTPQTPDWAKRFDQTVADVLTQRDTKALQNLWPSTEDGRLAHPTPDHFLPILYAYGASDERDTVTFPTLGFEAGSLSMRAVLFTPS